MVRSNGGGSLNADQSNFLLIEKQAADMIKKDTFNPKFRWILINDLDIKTSWNN